MTALAIQLLRRASVFFLVVALALIVVPRALRELGLIGPGVEEELARARNAVEAARAYGAEPVQSEMEQASRELARAEELARAGQGRDARAAARRAHERAIDAQRAALAERESVRREAERIVQEVDRVLNDLEDRYTEVTAGLPRPEVSRLFSLMKDARQAGATLFLAYEEDSFRKVLQEAGGVEAVLRSVGESLAQVAAARGAGGGADGRLPRRR